MSVQEQLREAFHWSVAGNYCGLKQQDAMIAAADQIDALEAALRGVLDVIDSHEVTDHNGYDLLAVVDARDALEASS